jgi:hypothetical protein
MDTALRQTPLLYCYTVHGMKRYGYSYVSPRQHFWTLNGHTFDHPQSAALRAAERSMLWL